MTLRPHRHYAVRENSHPLRRNPSLTTSFCGVAPLRRIQYYSWFANVSMMINWPEKDLPRFSAIYVQRVRMDHQNLSTMDRLPLQPAHGRQIPTTQRRPGLRSSGAPGLIHPTRRRPANWTFGRYASSRIGAVRSLCIQRGRSVNRSSQRPRINRSSWRSICRASLAVSLGAIVVHDSPDELLCSSAR